MSQADFFARFQRSAWRLETRPVYLGTEDAAVAAYQAGRPLPLAERPEAAEYFALVKAATRAGKRIGRVHVLELPLSAYLRFELDAYTGENVPAGEDIRIADRGTHPELAQLGPDFWLFDGERVLVMDYGSQGQFLGARDQNDRVWRHRARDQQALALYRSVPLAEFLMAVGG